ncbi:MAG: hypothetical protein KC479_08000 [Dehalococcoidia bacterium]|nr:hypothetical protein [Dehalococcoidia bacterium]
MDGPTDPPCRLTFERSPSPHYREALRMASEMPTYTRTFTDGRVRHEVHLTIESHATAERLLRLVVNWRGSALEIDGVVLYGSEAIRLLSMLDCHRSWRRLRLGTDYCWGLPSRIRGRVPCRLIDARLPWRPPDEYHHPRLLPNLVRALEAESFASFCPAYDPAAVQFAAASWAMGEEGPREQFEHLLEDLDIEDLGHA